VVKAVEKIAWKCCRIFGFDTLSRQFILNAFRVAIGIRLNGTVIRHITNCEYANGKFNLDKSIRLK